VVRLVERLTDEFHNQLGRRHSSSDVEDEPESLSHEGTAPGSLGAWAPAPSSAMGAGRHSPPPLPGPEQSHSQTATRATEVRQTRLRRVHHLP